MDPLLEAALRKVNDLFKTLTEKTIKPMQTTQQQHEDRIKALENRTQQSGSGSQSGSGAT